MGPGPPRALAVLALAFLAPSPAGGEVRLKAELIPTYFTGDFRSGVQTDVSALPLVLSVSSERHQFRITAPYLSIRTEEPVTFVGDEVIRRGAGASSAGAPGPGGAAAGRGAAASGRSTESGPGDVVLQEEFFFLQGTERRPWVSGIARFKLATADAERGLGTGEVDYGPGAGIIQPLGRRLSLVGTAHYVVRGDPAGGVGYRNTFWRALGTQVRVSEAATLDLFYEERQSILAGRERLRDVSLGYSVRWPGGAAVRSILYYGLSDTAEDWGASLGLAYQGP